MGNVGEANVIDLDPAVRRIRKLPKSKVKIEPVRMMCRRDGYRFDSIIQAWLHSELHGPWEPTDSGSRGHATVKVLTQKSFETTARYQNAVRFRERLRAMM